MTEDGFQRMKRPTLLALLLLAAACGSAEKMADFDRGSQQRSMKEMREIATANSIMRVDTGRYAATIHELESAGYMGVAPVNDGWGNAYVYAAGQDTYTVTSLGSDARPGPAPPSMWPNAPFEPDIVLTDGQFVQAPTGQ